MQKNESGAYWGMLGLSLAFAVLAVVTLLPHPAASKPNVLGYRSVCSFAPAASALCGLLAGITCVIRARIVSKAASSARYRPFIIPIAVAVLLLGVAAIFGIRFGIAQSRFASIIARTDPVGNTGMITGLADGTRSATFTDGEVSATVEVTVTSGTLASLRLVAGKNVDATLADTLFARVKAAGSTAVDAVSGATASSDVVLSAITAAARGAP
ncbi:MAG: FMN-binding protein [Spirochaetia bacterium]|jgi:uncharacterized protein with FMN-binding domain